MHVTDAHSAGRLDAMKISGNTIFILGSTSGIGLELALALQDKGNTVIIGGRRTELLDAISAAHPGLDTVHVDIADAGSWYGRLGVQAAKGNFTYGVAYQYQHGASVQSNTWTAAVRYHF